MILEPLTYTEQLEDDTIDMLATIALTQYHIRNFSFNKSNKMNVVKALWPSLTMTKAYEIIDAMNKQEIADKFYN